MLFHGVHDNPNACDGLGVVFKFQNNLNALNSITWQSETINRVEDLLRKSVTTPAEKWLSLWDFHSYNGGILNPDDIKEFP